MKKETNGPTRVEFWTARERRRYVIVPLLLSTIWGFVTMLPLLNERVMAQEVISEEEPTLTYNGGPGGSPSRAYGCARGMQVPASMKATGAAQTNSA